ncbi:hypothetical protein BCO9919_02863 [Burkholderia cenocepacia]|uniref:Uncharacterized protein n=2 Tax=Burkholderia TaxID=32008 RepID=A0A6J5J805_9BURK|nr:hypothetical protein BCO9919_02863 [Burkholderia cenocepacia]
MKQDNEFVNGVSHQSPIREMFSEGSGTAWYLKNSLDTSKINKGITISNYIRAVKEAIPPMAYYVGKGQQAQRDFEEAYPNNHTVQTMLRQYWRQWKDIEDVERLMTALSAIRPPLLSPLMVIRQYATRWERDAQLHQGIGEEGLRSQLVHALSEARYIVNSEVHSYQGHADIVVNRSMGDTSRFSLVAECKKWDGSIKFSDGISQLCRYVTRHVDMAAAIIFVTKGDFSEICKKAADTLQKHEACETPQDGFEFIKFSLILAQNSRERVPAAILLCNLTTPRYSR